MREVTAKQISVIAWRGEIFRLADCLGIRFRRVQNPRDPCVLVDDGAETSARCRLGAPAFR
jgi:hypothetical protein